MRLRELLLASSAPDVEVAGVRVDSRDIRTGEVFLAYRGSEADGHDYIDDALARGAAAVVTEREVSTTSPAYQMTDLKRRASEIAGRFYGDPSRSLTLAGVTGTNGKTSIAYLLAKAMADAGFLGTIGWGLVPGELEPAALTTVDAATLQSRLRDLADSGAKFVAMEVSSHALDQHRVDGVAFDVGIFSNLTRDHLDYHGTMEAYRSAKRRLFDLGVSTAVINVDDPVGREFVASLPMEVITVGEDADVSWRDVEYTSTGLAGRWRTPWGEQAFELPMFGGYSLSNTGAVVAAAASLGVPIGDIAGRLAKGPGIPGRMQFVADGDYHGKTVIIDYAHTPAGIRAALEAVRAHCKGNVTIVFGCGGDRDRGKRPEMARVAETFAERTVITTDNPRTEDVERILDDVEAGFSANYRQNVVRLADRHAAIRCAVKTTAPGDIVLVAGKGHEKYQEINGERLPFDDVAVARECLARER